MLGNVNQPKQNVGPTSAALNEALKLIAGMGGGDVKVTDMLKQMREVQKHNEEVASQISTEMSKFQTTVLDVQKREEALQKANEQLLKEQQAFEKIKSEEEMKTNLAKRLLERDEEEHRKDINEKQAHFRKLKNELDARSKELDRYEVELKGLAGKNEALSVKLMNQKARFEQAAARIRELMGDE